MALRTSAAFLAGVTTGWVLRSSLGSSREVMVRGIVAAHGTRDFVRRVAAERIEWLSDLFAEGRARYAEEAVTAPIDADETPRVDIAESRAA